MKQKKTYPVVLSIAGSDSSGGAGIQADLKTFSALGVYGASAITAITAQNTLGVHSQQALSPQMVYDQIVAVLDDLAPRFVKIGMLSNADVVVAVADALADRPVSIILDPVIVSSSGHRLLSVEAEAIVKERLLPMSLVVTPNIPEMAALTAMPLTTLAEREAAARHLMSYGVGSVLLKGGHDEGAEKRDILYTATATGIESTSFTTDTITTRNTHGTGCTLSSAITAFMARGCSLREAISRAKCYISDAIRHGADVTVGHGTGPVNHAFNPQKMIIL